MTDRTPAEIAASLPGRTTTYGYDLNGNIVSKTSGNGDTETDTFDVLNRATDEKINTASLTSEYGYAYDLVGNVTSIVETYPSGLNNRTVTNTYDAINRLHVESVSGTGGITTTYTYDGANNRTQAAITGGSTTNYVINNLNQTTSSSDGTRTETWTFDANGNASTCVVTGGSDNGTDTYSYDYENRLVGLVKGTAGGAGTYIYEYDYRTRRVFRYESSPGPGVATTIVFSGGTSVQEYDDAHIPFLTVEYIRGSDYGGGVGGILYSIRSGVPSYTHANRRGDVVAKTDSTGTLTFQDQYDAFGKQIATTGATLDRQKSNSKETDPTGLVDEGYRYRRGQVFLTRDPAGMVDGPNEYCYVRQNPWTHFDVNGLETEDQYNKDMASQQAGLDAYNKANPPKKRDTDSTRAAYQRAINKDKAGVADIEKSARQMSDLTETEVSSHLLDDSDQTYKDFHDSMAWASINPASNIAKYAAQGHYGAAAGEFAVDTAESLAIGKLAGLAFKALRFAAPAAELASRTGQVHSVLDPIAQTMRTTAGATTEEGTTLMGGGVRDLTPAQRAALQPGEMATKLPGAHAEVTVMQAAQDQGLTLQDLFSTRDFCPACRTAIQKNGGTITSPNTATWLDGDE